MYYALARSPLRLPGSADNTTDGTNGTKGTTGATLGMDESREASK
jgi:hypothetical protein